jgi:hypothetical protein
MTPRAHLTSKLLSEQGMFMRNAVVHARTYTYVCTDAGA